MARFLCSKLAVYSLVTGLCVLSARDAVLAQDSGQDQLQQVQADVGSNKACHQSIGRRAVRTLTWPVRRWRNFGITTGVVIVGTAALTAPVYPSREGPFSPATSMVAGARDFMNRSSDNAAQLEALNSARLGTEEEYDYSAQRFGTLFSNPTQPSSQTENP